MSGNLWAAVSTVIDQAQRGAEYAPLAESELVQAAVAFANGVTADGFLTLLGGLQLSSGFTPRQRKLVDAVAAEEFEPQRAQLAADLAAVVAGAATTEIAERAKRDASRIVLVPSYELERGALRVQHRYIAEDLDARLAYVTLLLLDRSRPYGARLCRCKLDGCGMFFWERRSERGGKPGRSFCKPAHMQEHHDARVTERVRKSREKKRRAKRKGKAK